ncbi:MAG: DUF3616 domain-containing protein [Burkholderiaceae bacterium]|nr:DUF3616 domain-containing protein [Burkholderiaceae bacterium]
MLRLTTLLTSAVAAGPGFGETVTRYDGLCDASAAVALDARHFVVAGDEDNTLRIFERGEPKVRASVPLGAFLHARKTEADLEAATRIGERIYWVGSLSRDGKGRPAPHRDRLFATDIATDNAKENAGTPPTLQPVGKAPVRLLEALVASDAGRAWQLAEAARKAPEAPGGLNVEGLTHTADGALLIGFRNPLREGKALVLPLRNPVQTIEGEAPEFGAAIALDLGGRGVRAMTRVADGYLVVGGPTADEGTFAVFHWRGGADTPQRLAQPALGTLRPEALFGWPGTPRFQLLSDDGGIEMRGKECKRLKVAEQRFRSLEFEPF